MNDITSILTEFIQQKVVSSAEYLIMSNLQKLQSFMQSSIPFDECKTIERLLINLFVINTGAISLQCAVFISSTLLKLYTLYPYPSFFDLISLAIDTPHSSTIVALGFIVKNIGNQFKAQLPRILTFLLSHNDHIFSSIYTIKAIIKTDGSKLTQYQNQLFSFINKNISTSHTILISFCSLLKCLALSFGHSMILNACREILQIPNSQNIQIDVSKVIATVAFHEIKHPQTNNNDNSERLLTTEAQVDYSSSFNIIKSFPQNLIYSFKFFLDKCSFDHVFENNSLFFDFIQSEDPNLIGFLIPYLSNTNRFSFFSRFTFIQKLLEKFYSLTKSCL